MIDKKLFGTNGVRGIANKTMTAEISLKLGSSLGTYLHNQHHDASGVVDVARPRPVISTHEVCRHYDAPDMVAVARDTRISGRMLKSAAVSGVLSAGCSVVDVGIVPIPALQYYVRDHADAGIMITASHNPREYNGLKLIAGDGTEFSREDEAKIEEIYYGKEFYFADWSMTGNLRYDTSVAERYMQGIIDAVDAERIKRAKLKVVIDTGCGAGSVVTPFLLQQLGCEVISLNAQLDGTFPSRNPEPTEDALYELIELVKATKADIGIAHDGDADRVALVDENGNFVSEEVLLAMMADHILRSNKGTVVTPVSSSLRTLDVVESHGCKLVWTAVGSINVARKMRETGAVFGGEGNGGLIFPELQYCRDGAMSAVKILEIISSGVKLSDIVKECPEYYNMKTKIVIEDSKKVMSEVAYQLKGEKLDTTDGLKVWYNDGWTLIRSSGTEPIIRIYSESKSRKRSEEMLMYFEGLVNEINTFQTQPSENCR